MPAFDVDALRAEFPALAREQDGRPVAFLDGPGGTQVPQRVIDAVVAYYRDSNANTDGAFVTSRLSDAIVAEAHAAVADFLGARSREEIKFGQNMTSLTLHIGRSIGATLGPGDEILVTTLDHEANVSTWRAMAADRGVTVQTVDINEDDVTLDIEDLESKLSPRTKLVAVGYASNAVGSVNPVKEIVARAHEVGALTYVDAVAFAPHGPIDVVDLDTDFLACSAYKWFGPHLGVLYGKAEVFDRLPAFKVKPAHDRVETGTQSFESISGALAATDYLRDVGREYGDVAGAPGAADASERRRELVAAMVAIAAYERDLVTRLIDGLEKIGGVTIHGIVDRARFAQRAPTVSVSIDGVAPRAAAEALGRQGIFAWDGDFYATGLIERLGKTESGGVLRLGLVHYNTAGEVDRVLEALGRIAAGTLRPVPPPSIRSRLARSFDPVELRAIKRTWVRHSIAEDARDIDGLIATLAEDCVYEIVPTGQRWEGHAGARRFYEELFAAFPDNAFALTEIVIGPQGAFEVATLTGTNQGPWGGVAASGLAVSLEVLILFPWDREARRFGGERIWFDRGALG